MLGIFAAYYDSFVRQTFTREPMHLPTNPAIGYGSLPFEMLIGTRLRCQRLMIATDRRWFLVVVVFLISNQFAQHPIRAYRLLRSR